MSKLQMSNMFTAGSFFSYSASKQSVDCVVETAEHI